MVDDRGRSGEGRRESPREERAREEREGNRGRDGFGDDGGTRVGRPTPADLSAEPSPEPSPAAPGRDAVDEGPEGSATREAHRPMGMGAEAAEGLHGAASERASGDLSGAGAAAREAGERDAAKDEAADEEGGDRQGSEPLVHRDTTHSSNYGGEMGEPRK